METPRCSEIPNLSADWKLNPNIECRITLNKLKIKTPEYGTLEFCRTLTNTTKDMGFDFKSEFILDVLLNDILRKCDEKCRLCEEYVQQLRHHIIQAHSASPQTQTVFKCDICGSIFSSPSMLIRHRNTHSDSDILTTPNTIESEPVRFDSNNIYTSFDISSVTRTNGSESSGQYENKLPQPVPFPPMNVEWNILKQEEFSYPQSETEISNPNPLGIVQHVNHLSTIENNLKQELNNLESQEDLMDPLLLQDLDLQVPSFVKSESVGISTESEQQTVDMSSSDMLAGEQSLGRTCGKGFPVPSDLNTHKITQSVQKPHKCDTCGKCFGLPHHLTQHKLTHTGEKPYKCDVCGKCFGQRSGLTRHTLTHTGEKPFRCDVCGRGFQLNRSLVLHKLTHTRERPHKCDVCGDCFTRRYTLSLHKLLHTGERSYECNVCKMTFQRNCYLTRHKLSHTGEKSHKCDVCGQSFTHRFVLTRHKWTHTKEKPFQCDVCRQSFRGRYELNQHKLKQPCLSTTMTIVHHLNEERESEEEGCQKDLLLNLEV